MAPGPATTKTTTWNPRNVTDVSSSSSPRAPRTARGGPLAGLRVIDIATIVAAPTAAALLSDYGADVLKVELPGAGDGLRTFAPFKDGRSLWWKVLNRDKQLVSLDLRKPEGRALFLRLVEEADVLVENFRPGTLAGWGLDAQTLRKAQPRLVILRATAFGQDGPYKDKPGFARIFEAMGGMAYISGEPDGEPMHVGYPIGDSIGGLFGALGVMCSLWKLARDPQAQGEDIDLSMTEGVLKLLDFLTLKQDLLGTTHERSGNVSQYAAPTGVYRTRDGHWVSLSGSTNALYAANCRAIGRPELIEAPRFRHNVDRCEHAGEINGIFRDWFAAHDLAHVLARFEASGGTIAPVYSSRQIVDDEQVKARGFLQPVDDEDFGRVRIPGVVPRFSNHPCTILQTARGIGADNEAVFKRRLGLSDAQLEGLAELKVI
jgi:crotonobetainyl-CoA:carnitine CoA-transferase CaiB-like acyl-CoA transferase